MSVCSGWHRVLNLSQLPEQFGKTFHESTGSNILVIVLLMDSRPPNPFDFEDNVI